MNDRSIDFDIEARTRIQEGVDILANAVKVTLGPRGRNVTYHDGTFYNVTKDGVTVAGQMKVSDPVKDAGVQMVKEVALRTANEAGDGTTTATLLSQAIVREGMKNIASGAEPISIKRGMDRAVDAVVERLKGLAKRIDHDSDDIENIATISANNDPSIGTIIRDAIGHVGEDGVVSIEPSPSVETYVDKVSGLQVDEGYRSPHFVTDKGAMTVEFNDPYYLLLDRPVRNIQELAKPIEASLEDNRPLVIVAEDFQGDGLESLVMNHVRGNIKVVAISAPDFGEIKTGLMEDMAAMTGAKLYGTASGDDLEEKFQASHFGQSDKIKVTRDDAKIISGKGDENDINHRIKQLKSRIENADNDNDKKRLKRRLAKLTGGVAVVYVGASSEIEMQEKKDRVDDALSATRSAIEEGVVPGGGVAYMICQEGLETPEILDRDEATGHALIRDVIQEPLRMMVSNTGEDGSVIVEKTRDLVKSNSDPKEQMGYNVKTGEYVNLMDNGIIDPTKVPRVALQNASSVAGMILTTECIITDEQKEKQ